MQRFDEQLLRPEYLAYSALSLVQEIATMGDQDFREARDMAEQAKLIIEQRIRDYDKHQNAA